MQLDLTFIKNETVVKFEKALTRIKTKYQDMLSIALDAASKEIDSEKREEVELALNDLFNDEIRKYGLQFITAINKASSLVENGLSK
jgi:hypothetical protein